MKETLGLSRKTQIARRIPIGNFRVSFRLCFKASPNAKHFHMEISFIHTQILVHLHENRTNFHVESFALGLALKPDAKGGNRLFLWTSH